MTMKQTLTKDMFRFQMNQVRPDNFSYEGQGFLFDHLEMFEEDMNEEIEFDPIAICCEYSECTYFEVINDYKHLMDSERLHDDEAFTYVLQFLEEHTIVVGETSDHKVIFQNF
jgi:ATP sulfurylase